MFLFCVLIICKTGDEYNKSSSNLQFFVFDKEFTFDKISASMAPQLIEITMGNFTKTKALN